MKAIWNERVIAQSEKTVYVEGNHYFPPDAIKHEFFKSNDKKTHCPWKGEASYYDLQDGKEVNKAAAWTYRSPKQEAQHIKEHVAFGAGVDIRE